VANLDSLSLRAVLVLAGGLLALLFTLYLMQQLSYSIGIYNGISTAIKAYNITNSTASNTLFAAASQSTSLILALHLSYLLLPFAIIILAMGIVWLFSKTYFRFMGTMLIIVSLVYLILVAVLEFGFRFTNVYYLFPLAYIGGLIALTIGGYSLIRTEHRHSSTKRPVSQISINPETPYSNMKLLSSKLMKGLAGEVSILDMHFDVNAMDNLIQLIGKDTVNYNSMRVLTSPLRLGSEFAKSYTDFKNELLNMGISFELRILDKENAAKQHERVLMDSSVAYKIPPLNIINKKSEHIVSIKQKEALFKFNNLWSKATKFENLKLQ
jgi:hypothetical protein